MAVLFVVFLGKPLISQGQHRLEFPVSTQELPYDLTPVGEYGFLLMEMDGSPVGNQVIQFNFKHYDAEFDLYFNYPVQVNSGLLLVAKEFTKNQLMFVFQNPRINLLQVTRIILNQRMVHTSLVDFTPGMKILDLRSWGNKAWISASLRDQPVLVEVDTDENKVRTLPTGIGFPVVSIHDMIYDSKTDELHYLMGVVKDKRRILALRTLNSNGRVVRDVLLGPGAGINILSAQIRYKESGFSVAGLYATGQADVPKGIALFKRTSDEDQRMALHPFKELKGLASSYIVDPNTLQASNGNLAGLKKEKGSLSGQILKPDNMVFTGGNWIISFDVYQKSYRSRNEEEREALGENINFAVNYNRYGANFPKDPENVSTPATNMLDEQRIRYQDYVVQSLIATGANFHHTAFLAFDSDLQFAWNFSLRFTQQDHRFAVYNKSLNHGRLVVSASNTDNSLYRCRIVSADRVDLLSPVSFAPQPETQTIAVMTDSWLGERNLIWGYQILGSETGNTRFFVQDLKLRN